MEAGIIKCSLEWTQAASTLYLVERTRGEHSSVSTALGGSESSVGQGGTSMGEGPQRTERRLRPQGPPQAAPPPRAFSLELSGARRHLQSSLSFLLSPQTLTCTFQAGWIFLWEQCHNEGLHVGIKKKSWVKPKLCSKVKFYNHWKQPNCVPEYRIIEFQSQKGDQILLNPDILKPRPLGMYHMLAWVFSY